MAASTSSSMEEQQRLLDEEELQQQQQQQQQHQQLQPPIAKEKECIHKTKLIQFLGRPTPIILQNDNGPCPLLAICNVLLLRNNLNLSPDTAEVSQEKLLSLVAERLIDSNSNVNNKDAGYIENQQQNIADAIDLLPRLATGIDVNIKFRRIDDFEFTRECAIFDLLDIPLYHGWIVDPQDCDTADAISFKSYNSIMGELVALETQCSEKVQENNTDEEDSVDFAAATTAALGVPSPCLSKAMSFDGRTQIVADYQVGRKGDLEEEAELLRALKLSEAEFPNTTETIAGNDRDDAAVALGKPLHTQNIFPANIANVMEEHTSLATNSPNQEADGDSSNLSSNEINLASSRTLPLERVSSFTNRDVQDPLDQLKHAEPGDMAFGNQMVNNRNIESSAQVESVFPNAVAKHNGFEDENSSGSLGHGDQTENLLTPAFTVDTADDKNGNETPILSVFTGPNIDSDSSSGRLQQTDEREAFTPSVDGSEPIYEGEECILDPSKPPFEDREPVYEGEVVLAKQAGKSSADVQEMTSSSEITPHQGELIRNFLRNNASQLTIYGLFCLQDGLKERELCVFFRNNHFSTMFKYEGELYLLATDQGYINQPDLVWEKLNEVNGDTLFMTGNFREFKVDEQSSSNWDEHNAVASTADYIASIDNASQAGFDVNSDLQLAIALQQQEFEQQQQRNGSQQTSANGSQQTSVNGSRLVTGPQVPRNNARYPSTTTNRADAKKSEKSDKCSIM